MYYSQTKKQDSIKQESAIIHYDRMYQILRIANSENFWELGKSKVCLLLHVSGN